MRTPSEDFLDWLSASPAIGVPVGALVTLFVSSAAAVQLWGQVLQNRKLRFELEREREMQRQQREARDKQARERAEHERRRLERERLRAQQREELRGAYSEALERLELGGALDGSEGGDEMLFGGGFSDVGGVQGGLSAEPPLSRPATWAHAGLRGGGPLTPLLALAATALAFVSLVLLVAKLWLA